MSDFDARHLDDADGLARLAEILHPSKAARSDARSRGRRRCAGGFAVPVKPAAAAVLPAQAAQGA
ncbi:hypothetical protein OPKNFCMD_3780 [Methylobacterium crusticola]|uniref:Deoxyribose-phosphate aldolase n=1 Tax=Methylobacterium crusticola TaxID=1697972 RepID=A0ABQ4R0S3_9HYPH|nr:hypothetical protein [Methylobacterium crusticola]GJD51029.1 hypothetical protein OPKNFCMD_3780 [Methylobacterium crusticola]